MPDTIAVRCPACLVLKSAPAELAGQRVKCLNCDFTYHVVPADDEVEELPHANAAAVTANREPSIDAEPIKIQGWDPDQLGATKASARAPKPWPPPPLPRRRSRFEFLSFLWTPPKVNQIVLPRGSEGPTTGHTASPKYRTRTRQLSEEDIKNAAVAVGVFLLLGVALVGVGSIVYQIATAPVPKRMYAQPDDMDRTEWSELVERLKREGNSEEEARRKAAVIWEGIKQLDDRLRQEQGPSFEKSLRKRN